MAEAIALRPVSKGKAGAAKGANFSAKSKRKAERKKLVKQRMGIRGHVANAVADRRLAAQERMAFYRGLRELKLRRRVIAKEFRRLDVMVTGMHREVTRVFDRYPDVDAGLVDEALMLVKRARVSVGVATEEMQAFSRRKVFYTEVAGVAA